MFIAITLIYFIFIFLKKDWISMTRPCKWMLHIRPVAAEFFTKRIFFHSLEIKYRSRSDLTDNFDWVFGTFINNVQINFGFLTLWFSDTKILGVMPQSSKIPLFIFYKLYKIYEWPPELITIANQLQCSLITYILFHLC